jgi:hypothetical protein
MRFGVSGLGVPLVVGVLIASSAAVAQPVGKARIGYLLGNPASDSEKAVAAFRAKLRDLGYVGGRADRLPSGGGRP